PGLMCFFFSSRRRHTRFSRDWSSDVCSSDLDGRALHGMPEQEAVIGRLGQGSMDGAATIEQAGLMGAAEARAPGQGRIAKRAAQIGRASCRERVQRAGGGGAAE